tara:strand:- start:386 stop:946 length:561 start_codon:yes stop_codon:yes gene_type:complete
MEQVPDTNNFNMDDVRQVVDSSKNELADLVTVANGNQSTRWDSRYSGSKNSLLNFRNYHNVQQGQLMVQTVYDSSISQEVPRVSNQTVDDQKVGFVWKYVSQSGHLEASIYYEGQEVYPGHKARGRTDVSGFLNDADGKFYNPFEISGGNTFTVVFEFVLNLAKNDTIRDYPDDRTTVNYHDFSQQ